MIFSLFAVAVVFTAGSAAHAQSADNSSPLFPKENKREEPASLREMLEKMRIEKEKKEFDEMIKRGQDVLDLSEALEESVDPEAPLERKDFERLDALDKLVKKIRSELGGGDDSEEEAADGPDKKPTSLANGFKSLRTASQKLLDDLKKTTRFSISASAIRSTNAVLRLTRWLRTGK